MATLDAVFQSKVDGVDEGRRVGKGARRARVAASWCGTFGSVRKVDMAVVGRLRLCDDRTWGRGHRSPFVRPRPKLRR